MNARAMVLSLVTGLGHVYLGHYILGAVLLSSFLVALNGIFLGWVIASNPSLGHEILVVSRPVAALIWIFGLAHAYKLSYGTDRDRLHDERTRFFREGLVAYLRGDLDLAARSLESTIERDVDWEDQDALFHLGVVELRRSEQASRSGDARAADRRKQRALRAFRMCLARDDWKKWRAEIAAERRRANLELLPIPAPPAAMPLTPRPHLASTPPSGESSSNLNVKLKDSSDDETPLGSVALGGMNVATRSTPRLRSARWERASLDARKAEPEHPKLRSARYERASLEPPKDLPEKGEEKKA